MMKLVFDFKGLTKKQAWGIARHNERVKGFYESNLISKNKIGGIDLNKISNNLVLTKIKSFKDEDWLRDKKIAGGRQKNAIEFTGWVIQAGGLNNTLNKEDSIAFLTKADKWIKNKFVEESIMGSVIQLDEVTPQLQIVMNNLSTDNNKNYLSAKRKFGYQGLTQKQVRIKAKEIQNDFWNDVAKEFKIEKPSKELGEKGKVEQATWQFQKMLSYIEQQKKKVVDLSNQKISLKENISQLKLDSNIEYRLKKLSSKAVARGEFETAKELMDILEILNKKEKNKSR
ncbi:MAG: plasmid recombination protein [Mollicutes bacterium PWAP]|nr:plasmid recombination protein [Mollicutes bacterium PWAP]